jgi:hypothetical protein
MEEIEKLESRSTRPRFLKQLVATAGAGIGVLVVATRAEGQVLNCCVTSMCDHWPCSPPGKRMWCTCAPPNQSYCVCMQCDHNCCSGAC